MKNTLAYFKLILILLLFCAAPAVYGQLSGIKKIPGDYATITLAVADLNTSGVGPGGVTFDVAAGYTETITATISLTATGTAGNPITFRRDPATPGVQPLITAYTGGIYTPGSSIQDGIWRLVGSDYVTIDGISLTENPANTSNPATMEYGYALYKASTSNGCQYVTVANCVVSLTNINNAAGAAPMVDGSTGIIVMNATASAANNVLTPVAGGTNSYNKFYGNTIQNCNTGIALIGYSVPALPSTLGDKFNDVGGNTALTGNSILNYGGAPTAILPAAGIRTSAQYNFNASYNTINNNNGSGNKHPTTLRGIYLNTALGASATVTNNTVTIHGGGTTENIAGIENLSGGTAATNSIFITHNTIKNSTYTTATSGGFTGILNNAANPETLVIRLNSITNNSSAATTTGFFYGIHNSGPASVASIDSNLISGNSSTSSTLTGNHIGIYNTGVSPVLNVTVNTVAGNVVSAITGVYFAIANSGAVTSSININSNHIGTASLPAVSFSAGSSVNHIFISNSQGGASSNLSISNNRFSTVQYLQAGTGGNTYISNAAATRSQVINSNTFTNMDVNTAGSITFILNSVAVPATGTQSVNGNSISGTFVKSGPGGVLTLFSSTASSLSGSVINNSNNNFSNITVVGATTISGWVNTDAGAGNKFIQNNIFSKWTAGTGGVTATSVSITGVNNATSGNLIESINSAGAITGILTSAGNDNIFSNTITALSTTGGFAVTGISANSGTKKDIYRNKVYNLQASHAGGTVIGIAVSGSSIVKANLYNNLLADLRAPISSGTNAVIGINAISTKTNSGVNIFYNTIYVNAVSSGTTFGTSGINHTSNNTATTATLDLRNNIIVNTSTPNGAGLTVAFRKSATTLGNYASTSNNNLLYGGPASTNRLLFFDGTNQDQILSTFKARVTPREALSVTEDLVSKFMSTSGLSPDFLHLDPLKPTQAESGAGIIAGYTTDYEAQLRQGNAGYAGTGTAPDIGADEFAGTGVPGLQTSYNVGNGETFTSLTNAGGLFASINSLGLTGNVVANITSDLTEDGTNSLYQWAEQGTGNYTVTIRTNTSSVKLISGNVQGPMIRLSGVKRLTIDGSNGTTTNFLTFRNTNPGGNAATALTLINGTTNTMIRYCNFEANATATNGVILFSTSTLTGGNSNNTITNCAINATVNSLTGSVCVYSAGTATAGFNNTGNIVSNSSLYNYRDRALEITATGSTAWVISGNSLFNGDVTGGIDYAASSILQGIRILGGSGYSIVNNFIGGSAAGALGTAAFYSSTTGLLTYQGILLTTNSASPASNIKGNTITNLSIAAVPLSTSSSGSSFFFGIETNGSGINIGGSTQGDGNMIGSKSVNGSILLTTTTSGAFRTNARGIFCNSTGGLITGNQVGGIDIRNMGSTTGPSTFLAIHLSAAAAPTQVSNNIVGSTGVGALANSIRVLPSSVSTTTSFTGISIGPAVTSAVQVTGNIVENVSYQKTVASGPLYGITNSAASSSITITGNTIRANTMNASTGTLFGIYNSGAAPSLTISTNLVTGNITTAVSGSLQGIYINTTAVPGTVSINSNTFSSNTNSTSTGAMVGVNNLAPVANLSVTSNTFNGNVVSSAAGQFFAINSNAAVTTSLNINSNNIGTSISPAVTFSVANSGTQAFVSVAGATGTSSLSISNNQFYNILYSANAIGASTFILNAANTLHQSINSNVFTDLNLRTASNVTLISNSVIVPATGTQNVNNNSISGTFTKPVSGGTVTFLTSTSTSIGGAVININDNNFSNVNVAGTSALTGLLNTDAGTSTKTIQNNAFTNWTAGAGNVVAMSINLTSTSSSAQNNLVNTIAGAGAVTGITTAAGNDKLVLNTINTLSTSGSSVTGISVTAGTTKNIFRNKIYDLSSSSATGVVNGILVTSGLTVNIANNLLGDLRAPAGNATTDLIRGISITSALASSNVNIYYNTIYLNAVSSGQNFNTAGIYHLANATSSVAMMNLRNNSITNTSTPNGSGATVVLRRSAAALANYALTSNNNLLYAGAPGTSRLIYSDGTNPEPTLPGFKTRVSGRETASVSEDLTPKYLTTTGSSPLYLHMNTAIANALESGAANIEGYTDDFDGQVRAGNPGYSGVSSVPDIGADEIFGIENSPPTITYTLLNNTVATTNRIVTGVSISDISGVNNNPGTRPRIYYKRFTDANVWLDNTPATSGWKFTETGSSSSPYSFTIDYSRLKGGATGTAGIIQYFIVAQDLATIGNVAINSGNFATTPTSVALGSAAFPIAGTINSFKIPFSGTYKVGTNEVFTSLTKADGLFASINSVGLFGSTTFNITSDIVEDGTHALDEWVESGSGNYTLTIKPDVDALRTISGDVPGDLIRLNGADRVIINGSNNSDESYLAFKNVNTSGTGTAFTFSNGASYNSLTYVIAEASAANGVVFFSTSAVAGGNSNNLVDNCTISASVNLSFGDVGIRSAGTAGAENSSNIISNNIVSGYRSRGLDISEAGTSAWMIADNSFFNGNISAGINYPASSALHGIRILGGSGYSILNNSIGGSANLASGAIAQYSSSSGNVSFEGILLHTTSAAPVSEIKRNTIASIAITSIPTSANSIAFTGISITGSGINIGGSSAEEGNTVGSATGNGSIVVNTSTSSVQHTTTIIGISTASTGGVVNNNEIGAFDIANGGSQAAPSLFHGIFVNGATASTQVNNNLVGSASTPNSIRVLAGSTSQTNVLTGIGIGSMVNSQVQVSGNLVENFANLSTTASGSFTGIDNTATLNGANITISTDTIQFINSANNASNTAALFSGIRSSSAATINNNLVSHITLSSAGTNAQVTGIFVTGNYPTLVSGNLIQFLSTTSQKAGPSPATDNPLGSAIIGLFNSTTSPGQIIRNNRVAALTATSLAPVSVTITGFGISSTGSGSIFNNRFGTMTNTATGPAPAIIHIKAANGIFNVYNNTLRISNLAFTNGVHIFGIVHSSLTSWNYFHNTVRASGHSNGIAMRSAAFILSVNSSPVLKNNILFNIRTGTGSQHAVSNLALPPSTWPSSTSDYNNLYTNNPATVGEWGGSKVSFSQWKTLSGGDEHSISSAISFIQSPYDLRPDSITNCSFNNAGTPITSPVLINSDIDSTLRNPASPDLGAYEFHYAGFNIVAESNSPICSGDSIYLSVFTGEALVPSYSWRNSTNQEISNLQNPVFASLPGLYTITVTDSTGCFVTDSVLVIENQRPTARITSVLSLCDSGNVVLNIAVTGKGTINGTLSNGDQFSGTAPLIVLPVFLNTTTSISIITLSDSVCTSIPTDIPDTLTISVTPQGDWLGINSNWNDPVNWCGGIVPDSARDVVIPTGSDVMPVITDTAYCKNLLINAGATVTISSAGTLMIAGSLTNNGTFTDNGTTHFKGTTGQQTFAGVSSFNNVVLDNINGLRLPAAILIKRNLTIGKGTLTSNNYNIAISGNWANNASVTAFTAGSGTVTFIDSALQYVEGAFSTTFNNLVIQKTVNPLVLAINTSIAGNLSITSGTFDLAGFTANRAAVGGTITISNNTTLKIGGTNSFPLNYSSRSIGVGSTVEYSGTNQLVSNQEYGNLAFSSSGGTAVKTLPGTAMVILGNLITMVGNGTFVSVNPAASVNVKGNILIGVNTAVNGGSYLYDISGNWLNHGSFNGESGTVTFSGTNKTVGGPGNQDFNNVIISASGILFSADTLKLTGNFATTGSGSLNQAPGGTLVMNGNAKTISGVGISLTNLLVNGTVTTSATLAITGNLTVAGGFASQSGIISLTGTAKTIAGAGSMNFFNLSIAGSYTSASDYTINSSLVVYGSLVESGGTVTFAGASTLSGNANLYNVNLNGSSLKLSAGSSLGIANNFIITNGMLDVAASRPNTVNYNGALDQNILAIEYSHLVLSNGYVKTASGPVSTLNDLVIGVGTGFNAGSYTHNVYGNWVNRGSFTPGTSTVQFSGPFTAYITGPTTFNILNSNASDPTTQLILQDNVTASIVNMISGGINTGAKTLTITGTRTGEAFILGHITRSHSFASGVAYAFEGPQNTITFSTVSGVNSVAVFIQKGSVADFPFGGSIGRVYDISIPGGTYEATLRLHYLDDELNGNAESSMGLWQSAGSAWSSVGKTGNSTTLNYVEQSELTDISKRWTLSDNSNIVQWTGSVSSDWNNAGNWTVLQGSGSRPPSPTDIVDLGSAPFLHQPVITSDVTVKNIIFESIQEVTLTLGPGGSLTTVGDISGKWTGNATHTIHVNDRVLTVNGNINLGDSTTGHAINLNITTGTVAVLGSLSQTGGANIIFTGAGLLSIHEDFNHTSGTFTAGSSTVVYGGDENQHVAEIDYNNLTIDKNGGVAIISVAMHIAGDLRVSSGSLENDSTTTIAGDVIIDPAGSLMNFDTLHVSGNWTNNGNYLATGSSTIFEGTGTQTISPTTFHNLTINKPSGTAELNGEVVTTGDLIVLSGILDFKTYSITRQVAGGTTMIAAGAIAIIGGNNGPVNYTTKIIDISSTIIYNGSDMQYISSPGISYGNIIFRNGGVNAKVLVTPASIKGNLTIEPGATLYGADLTINLEGNWTNNGTFIPATGNVIFAGTTKTLAGATTFYRSSITGSYNVVSDIGFNNLFEITSSGSITASSAISATVRGNLVNSGVLITNGTATFTGDTLQTISLINATTMVRKVIFNGSVSPVLYSTTPVRFNVVNINNSGGINPTVNWTIFDTLNIGNNASFNGGISTHILHGNLNNNGTVTSSGVLHFIPSVAVLINLGNSFTSTGTVVFGGSGLMTLAGNPTAIYNLDVTNTHIAGITPEAGWNVTNNFTVVNGSLFNAGSYNFLVGGNFSNRGLVHSGTSTFTLNGAANQDVYNISPFYNLTVNKAGGSAILSFDVTVTGVLNFVAGNIQTGVNLLIQPSSGSVTNAGQSTGWVNGSYQKFIPTGAPAKNFEVGDATRYAPVSLVFSNVSAAGNLTASSTRGDHPNLAISQINRQKSVNRYWTLTNNGIAFTHYSGVYNFAATDVDSGANTADFKVSLFNGSSWSMPATSLPNPINIRATTVTAFGSFAAGEICNVGTSISYTGSPFCSSVGNILPTINGTEGGTFTSTFGLSINSTTGAIDLGASNTGNYKVTYTLAATSECGIYITSTDIVVTTQPFANWVYNGNPYCVNGGLIYPSGTQTGPSGKMTSSPGLEIDSLTGAVNLGLSLPGSYMITYTVLPSGGCALYSTNTTLVIEAVPSATISYGGTPYCSSAGVVSVTHSGTPGGTYSSEPGLAIDSLTGSINTAESIAGQYTVNYTIAAHGCPAFTTAYDIEITMLPSATIIYSGSPFCNVPGTASPTITGTMGGSFHSTPGLMIDSATGVISLGTSTPGYYLVTYFMSAFEGCDSASTTTMIAISVSPSASISYEGSPFSNLGTASVTRNGTQGGDYSSSEGLDINPLTGTVNLATSSLGVYEVFYTIDEGGCEPFRASASITIYSLPVVNPGFSPDLKTAANFVLFTIAGAVGNTGPSLVTGNIGTNIGAINSFGATPLACARHSADPLTLQASADLMAAYNQLDTVKHTALHDAVLGHGETLYAGVYSIAAAGSVASVLNLDAQGNPDAVFIFKIGGAFNTGASAVVNLLNGASSCNVFWKADGAIAMGALTQMKGTLIANGAISLGAGGTLDGRMFSISGAIAVDAVTATIPGCFRRVTSWTGAAGTDWNNACNWLYAEVPTGTTYITIPSALVNYPVLNSGIGSTQNIVIEDSATLTVTNAILQIAGNILTSGTINASNGSIEFNGSTEQMIPDSTFAATGVKSLTINNNAGVSLGGPISIIDVLTVSQGSLVTNGYLTLKSTATGTARVARITSSVLVPIVGNVTVERFIPGRRKYRLVTSSVTTSVANELLPGEENLSIWANWQNQGNNITPKSGNLITGGTLGDGFDQQSKNASLFTYDEARRSFAPFSTANGKNTKYTPLKAGRAYYMFVYGDRTNSIFDTTPDSTVLAATGTLLTGDQRFNTTTFNPLSNVVNHFSLLGNPFASPVDWSTISRTNLADTYWGWDPNLSNTGGYVTVSSIGGTVLISPFSGITGLNQFIQPGQGFFVKTTAPFPVLTIREQDKAANFNASAFRTTSNSGTNNMPLLAINLLYERSGVPVLADGALAAFHTAFSSSIGAEDASKLLGSAEWLGLSNTGQLLSIDGRPLPNASDTLRINMAKLTRPVYTLQVFASNMSDKNVTPYLEDTYLNTSLALSVTDTNLVKFNVDPLIAASSDISRFRITFRQLNVTPQEAGMKFPYNKMKLVTTRKAAPSIKVYPNPVVNQQINLHMIEIEQGSYTLVMQNSRGQQLSPVKVEHRGGTGHYRITLTQRVPAGIYYLHLNYKKVRYSEVILIE